jgi:YfiH family protein
MLRVERDGLVFYPVEALSGQVGLVHGVFTRLGGVSAPPFDSLNTSISVGDDQANVEANRRAMYAALGIPPEHVRTVWQVHSADVVIINGSHPQTWPPPKADIIITQQPGLGLTMRFADCVPVLLYDPNRRVVGMAHAGWRGTVQHVGQVAVQAMSDTFGCDPADIIAGIGPAIGPCCYEVGPEVVAQVAAAFGGTEGLISSGPGGVMRLDLWAANRHSLRQAGVERVEVTGLCTACHHDEFFSHRAEHGMTGRFGALAGLAL